MTNERLLWILAGVLLPASMFAQTCCSGGVPLSSNIGLPPGDGRTLQFSLSYDLNVLQTLKTGTEILDDDSRSRRTHSVLAEFGYNFTERFSVDAFFSWVRQEREINQFGNTNFNFTQGIGDAVFLFKYQILKSPGNQRILTAALGAKPPVGPSDLTNGEGLTANADLQPGSGAWDGIAWGQFTQVLPWRPTMSLTATASYSLKGENPDYLGSQVYQFGNELQVSAGISDRLIIGEQVIDPGVTFRYRRAGNDLNNGQDVPSTGGQWVFINPTVGYWLHPDMSLNANVTLPLFADIAGTQVTPTYRFNLGFFYRFQLGKNDLSDNAINPFQ